MKQLTLAAVGFERYAKTTRRAAFLAEMERVVPWSALCALIQPFYPKPGNGRPPIGVERMLRIYFLQQWFNLSDPAAEEALYDSSAMRRFVGIDLGCEPVPDETTVCRFRHLLEAHDLGQPLFDEVQQHLASKGLKVATGTIVDATIINAPSSTKNADSAVLNNFNLQRHLVSGRCCGSSERKPQRGGRTLLPRHEPEMLFIPPFPILLT
jgi:transposase, IS5 family